MYTFMFIVLFILLFFSKTINALWSTGCNESKVIFPADSSTEIHAMLARDRYINFIGWSQMYYEYEEKNLDYYSKRLNESGGTEDISYGYLKEMVLHLNSISEEGRMDARIFLTSGKDKLLYVYEVRPIMLGIEKNDWFFKFKLLEDGIQIKHIFIKKNGELKIDSGYQCLPYVAGYTKEDYSKIDGLLIEIDCKTTIVKKILVKVHPK